MTNVFEIAGKVSLFGLRATIDSFRRPFEGAQIMRQLAEVGSKSLALVIASGFALGAVMTLHTRTTLVTFGATSLIPRDRERRPVLSLASAGNADLRPSPQPDRKRFFRCGRS